MAVAVASATTFTVTRGFSGTTAAAHAVNATVRFPLVAANIEGLRGAVKALEAKLGVGASSAASAATGSCQVKQADGTTQWATCGSPSAMALDDLSDVAISAPALGKYLRHNGTLWVDGVIQATDLPAGIDVVKLADGSVSNAEFQRLDGVTSPLQTQLDAKASAAFLAAHVADTANPHAVTKTQIGLSAVTNDAQLKAASNLSDVPSPSTARGNLGLGTSAVLNVPATGNAATGEVVKGSDTRLTDARAPTTHTHAESDVTNLITDLAAKQPLDSDLTAVAGLSTNGLVARTATGAAATRTIAPPAAGVTVTNGDGVAGNPTLALANDLSALEALSSTGLAARTGTDTWAQRTITGTPNQVNVANGSGAAGNPTLSLPQSIHTAATPTFGGVTLGTAIIQPSLFDASGALDFAYPTSGGIRFAGSTTFSDGAAFQGFGGLHSLFPGQMYFDYGSLARTLTGRKAVFRSMSPSTFLNALTLDAGGNVVVGGGAAISTSASDGFLYLPTTAGTPTGTPTSQAGAVATVYDTSNSRPCVYNAAWRCSATLNSNGSFSPTGYAPVFATVTGATTATATSYGYFCNAASGAVTITLPAASTTAIGQEFALIKTDSSANSCSFARSGSDLISGATAQGTVTQYASITVTGNGSTAYFVR